MSIATTTETSEMTTSALVREFASLCVAQAFASGADAYNRATKRKTLVVRELRVREVLDGNVFDDVE